MNLPARRYTEKELERARSTERVLGWLQGAGVVVGGAVLWNLLGWIPLVVVLLAVGWVVVRVVGGSGGKDRDEPTAPGTGS